MISIAHYCFVPYSEVYLGSRYYDGNGNNCDSWSNHPNYTSSEYPFSSLNGASCRNPGAYKKQPWCFISKDKWEYCSVPMCPLAPTFSAQYPLGSKLLNKCPT